MIRFQEWLSETGGVAGEEEEGQVGLSFART